MEEQALYRAILAGPHDDAARLVYADWLDENADRFPSVDARAERARAEFIRSQCKLARLGPPGWMQTGPTDPELAQRQKRLLFRHGKSWRRAYPIGLGTAPFDRGFLRPFRALRPQEFLARTPASLAPATEWLQTLPADGSVRWSAPDDPFAECPLWDIHLFASGWRDDPLADHGQYADLLAEVGRSPMMERVGLLKVSFFQTPVYDFLRTGNFANVETLVLNAGPFPGVLEAVAENESFRSLRYVQFGSDWWAWAGLPLLIRYVEFDAKLRVANDRHLPFGEMRAVLHGILRDTPVVPPAPPVRALQRPLQFPTWASAPAPPTDDYAGMRTLLTALWIACVVIGVLAGAHRDRTTPSVPEYKYQVPVYDTPKLDPDWFRTHKHSPEMEAILKRIAEGKPAFPPGVALPPEFKPGQFTPRPKPPVAPPPRPVDRKDDHSTDQ